jgi:hypothetical protein
MLTDEKKELVIKLFQLFESEFYCNITEHFSEISEYSDTIDEIFIYIEADFPGIINQFLCGRKTMKDLLTLFEEKQIPDIDRILSTLMINPEKNARIISYIACVDFLRTYCISIIKQM